MKDLSLEVLISCMYQKDLSIVQESNLNSKVLVINQCDCDFESIKRDGNIKIINTPERGLSKSRNKAISNAEGDICLIADNDELFIDDLEEKIRVAYQSNPTADLIIFKIKGEKDKFGGKRKKIGKLRSLKVRSVQITFKLDKIKNKVWFDENLGAGTELGSGEENKFLLECIKNKLNIIYVPIEILSLRENESTWFHGFSEDFFYHRGRIIKYIYGKSFAIIYCLYFIIRKRKLYKNTLSFFKAFKYIMKGIFDSRE